MTERKPRRYLRKNDLLVRYGWKSKMSIDRAVTGGRLPQPDMYMGNAPLWLEQTLDRWDAQQAAA